MEHTDSKKKPDALIAEPLQILGQTLHTLQKITTMRGNLIVWAYSERHACLHAYNTSIRMQEYQKKVSNSYHRIVDWE